MVIIFFIWCDYYTRFITLYSCDDVTEKSEIVLKLKRVLTLKWVKRVLNTSIVYILCFLHYYKRVSKILIEYFDTMLLYIILCISGLRGRIAKLVILYVYIYFVINFSSTSSKFATFEKVIRILHWMLRVFYKILLLYRLPPSSLSSARALGFVSLIPIRVHIAHIISHSTIQRFNRCYFVYY